jgi:hypothetical protein
LRLKVSKSAHSNGDFCLKVFDPALRPQRLIDSLDKAQRTKLAKALPNGAETQDLRFAKFELETTFGDVEGRAICFEPFERPYKRCLNLQARLARAKAVRENWITPYESFWAEGWRKWTCITTRSAGPFSQPLTEPVYEQDC